jgi:uncharacterized protein DUF1844
MSDPLGAEYNPTPEQMMTALFAHLVMQQTNMAMMLLGKVPHPETGQTIKDIEAAKLFIDQLEMIEVKTKGNLSKEEANLLKQNLMSLRLAFVEAVDSSPSSPPAMQKGTKPVEQAKTPEPAGPVAEPVAPAAAEDEHRKKFTKKY